MEAEEKGGLPGEGIEFVSSTLPCFSMLEVMGGSGVEEDGFVVGGNDTKNDGFDQANFERFLTK